MFKIFQFLIASALIHAALVAGVAWALSATGREKVIATLDLSSVELSFAEDEREAPPTVAMSSGAATPPPQRLADKVPQLEKPVETQEPILWEGEGALPPLPEKPLEEPPMEKLESVVSPQEATPSPPQELAANEDSRRHSTLNTQHSSLASASAPRQARVDAPPRPQRAIRPDYPRGARQRGEQGDVVLEIAVAADGSVASVSVATSSGFADLDAAALKAVRSARFSPAKSGDQAVASTARLTLAFKLK